MTAAAGLMSRRRPNGRRRDVICTDDIFLGGFVLSRGGELAGVEVRGINGRRLAFFRIEGAATVDAEREFYGGQAVVNLLVLKSAVRRLKDAAFQAIREEESRDAAANHEGRDRTYQGGEPARRRHR
jgi:hypothetical protein